MTTRTQEAGPAESLAPVKPPTYARVAGVARDLVVRWGVLVVAVVVWHQLARSSTSGYFPVPTDILDTTRTLWFSGQPPFVTDLFTENVGSSLGRLLQGWALAVVIGIAGGVLIGSSALAADMVRPLLDFMRSIPSPAVLPVFLVLLGIGDNMRVSLIAFVSLWPVLLNTVEGVRTVDRVKLDTARVFGLGRVARLRHVVFPAASPKILAGMRVALSLGLNLMVISELVAANNGVGHFVDASQDYFRIVDMWSGIIMIVIIGILLNLSFMALEKRLLRWHIGERA
ncbi:ABC transporter permease [Streptomyces albipurpureus]|uniref:ABC transporter permease n=1 Tax=Streptomyces albipurpureus TaxID=2897419 RepID=A0ABT0UWZ3_9ACTN|nr:ABC transporter permease [Streptomyces sp. CWNU-1]MCM2391868.1 ABC transporter permease [Streptomyces sp. CWNU-1]